MQWHCDFRIYKCDQWDLQYWTVILLYWFLVGPDYHRRAWILTHWSGLLLSLYGETRNTAVSFPSRLPEVWFNQVIDKLHSRVLSVKSELNMASLYLSVMSFVASCILLSLTITCGSTYAISASDYPANVTLPGMVLLIVLCSPQVMWRNSSWD